MMEFALRLNPAVEVIAADCDPTAAALHVSGVRAELTPPALEDSEAYIACVRDFARRQSIDMIVPLSDLDLESLAAAASDFRSFGCAVAVSSPEVIKSCVDKLACFSFCRQNNVPMPESVFRLEDRAQLGECIVKPIRGSGSAGARRVTDERDLEGFVSGVHMLQEWIDGEEYGLDIFNDFSGTFAGACVKRKILMRAGETDRSVVVHHPEIELLAQQISQSLRHVGNLDVDLLENADGKLYCIDFNPRFGGGYPATHLAGMNFLRALIDLSAGRPVDLPKSPNEITVMKGISVYSAEAIA